MQSRKCANHSKARGTNCAYVVKLALVLCCTVLHCAVPCRTVRGIKGASVADKAAFLSEYVWCFGRAAPTVSPAASVTFGLALVAPADPPQLLSTIGIGPSACASPLWHTLEYSVFEPLLSHRAASLLRVAAPARCAVPCTISRRELWLPCQSTMPPRASGAPLPGPL